MKEIEELQEEVTINEMIDVLLLDQLNAIYHQHGSQSNYYAERRDSTRFALLSKFREIQEQVERLKCCGNCKHSDTDWDKKVVCCLVEEKETKAYKYCDNWQSDGLTAKDRKE